ncbi:MAG TPA: FUSC family protein [Beutenbergiaceae bacterium]|nr:FUSC family protein [Beutenbergiaceae bacterium]
MSDSEQNPGRGRRLLVGLRQRKRQGWRRVKSAFFPVLLAALAAGGAWSISHYLIGHAQPFFAPIAAWVCLGFGPDRQVRKVAELAVGVTLGVVMGEIVAHLLGTGLVPLVIVIVVASLIARFIDRGILLTIQAGVQGIVIVALPVISSIDGASGRWIDALIGSGLALLVAALTPGDARRRARELARGATFDLAHMLNGLANGLETGHKRKILDALVEGRGTQGVLDEWSEVVRNAQLAVRISPASRYYLPELAELKHASLMVDRAMRNARVITRRAATAVEQGPAPQEITHAIRLTAQAVKNMGEALGQGKSTLAIREELNVVAGMLSPRSYDDDWRWQTLVIIMRSLVVDVFQATGLSAQAASATLG